MFGGSCSYQDMLELLALLLLCGSVLAMYYVGVRRLYVALTTLPRDVRLIYRFKKLMYYCNRYSSNNESVVSLFSHQLKKNGNKPCLYYMDQVWSYSQVEDYSNQVAQVFHAAGYKKDDVVALFMKNCPEFICVWLGLAKLGVVSALVNINVRGNPLVHSLKAAAAKAVVFSEDLVQAITEIEYDADFYQLGGSLCECASIKSLDSRIASASKASLRLPTPGFNDDLLYIYTSGTTGLPKAAIVRHSRYLVMTMATYIMLNLNSDDIIYNPLPLYHAAGGAIGTGLALTCGLSIVIRTKFSASSYFPDCRKYNCTVAQYIGEVCRYILATPSTDMDTKHSVRLMVGNGLRPKVWKVFIERFQVPQIYELYGATEGNSNIVCIDNTCGAVGFLPRCIPLSMLPIGLVKVDMVTGEPLRNEKGLCIRSEIGEPGLFVGLINEGNALREYHGYVDKEASQKKVLENVFRKGDKGFSSGDILEMDEYGYLYFRERIGDTFRWKGENVSTAEVETVLSNILGLRELAVYGVQVPETEGKAGMAAIADPARTLDLQELAGKIDKSLPFYARPIFIRIVNSLDTTATFKITKVKLQEEGFDPAVVKDPLYFRTESGVFAPITLELHENIKMGKVRI